MMTNFIFAMAISATLHFNIGEISKAISTGDADALGQYLDQTVEIAILDQEGTYDKARAISVLKQFFTKNPARGFSQVHQGTSKGSDSQYCIGDLSTNTATYRVYIYMKSAGGKFLIQELRFDRQ
jgi:hypothetical protein